MVFNIVPSLKQSIKISARSSQTTKGEATWSTEGSATAAFVQQTDERIVGTDGTERTAVAMIIVGPGTTIASTSRVELPDGTHREVIRLHSLRDAKGNLVGTEVWV
jgi:hypothetical protein